MERGGRICAKERLMSHFVPQFVLMRFEVIKSYPKFEDAEISKRYAHGVSLAATMMERATHTPGDSISMKYPVTLLVSLALAVLFFMAKHPEQMANDGTPRSTTAVPSIPPALLPDEITILAYGALLSEASSRLTFPDLKDFRHVRVRGLRRVFAHPHLFLLSQGLTQDMNMASLSAEPADDASFVVAAFQVKLNHEQRLAFMEREASYEIVSVPYYDLEVTADTPPLGMGVICLRGTDTNSQEFIAQLPPHVSVRSIWQWPHDSGLLPADIYLRHCLLAVEKATPTAKESFWNDTYLADRTTRLVDYLSDPMVHQRVMNCRPPPELATRFGG